MAADIQRWREPGFGQIAAGRPHPGAGSGAAPRELRHPGSGRTAVLGAPTVQRWRRRAGDVPGAAFGARGRRALAGTRYALYPRDALTSPSDGRRWEVCLTPYVVSAIVRRR